MSAVVERLLSQGIIKESQVQDMEEFHDFIKESGWLSNAWKSSKPHIFDFGKAMATAVPAAGIVAGGSYLAGSMDRKDTDKRLALSLQGLMASDKSLQTNPNNTVRTFQDIASIAPNVAQNTLVMSRVLPEAAHKGLNTQGISNLVMLEKNMVLSRQGANRQSMLSNTVRKLAPVLATKATDRAENYAHQLDMNANLGSNNSNNNSSNNSSNKSDSNNGTQGKTIAKTMFKSQGSDIAPVDSSKEFPYLYLAAKKAKLLPREVSKMDPTNSNDVQRFNMWTDKNLKSFSDLMQKMIRFYGSEEAYVNAGKNAYEARYGTEKKAEFLGEVLADALFLKNAAAPVASGSIIMNALKGLAAASIVGASFGIVEEAADYSRNKTRKGKLVTSWGKAKEILERMPDNVKTWNGTKENLSKAQGAFNAMISVAPDLAVNPVIAASFINTTLNNQGLIDANSLKALTDSQKNYTASNNYTSPFAKSPFFTGATSGFSAAGGKKVIDSTAAKLISDE